MMTVAAIRGQCFEWGPRALGARSIVADPRRAEMKEIVNAKIKFREAFRPFAPSVLGERCEECFELPNAMSHHPARCMLYVVPVNVAPFRCSDHLPGSGCEAAVATCDDAAGTGRATVANCCDPSANEWQFQTCDFSEFLLAENFADLIPGQGTHATDCVAEWFVDNPQNVPFLDRKGRVNFKQTCRDGDALCDSDGAANGQCVFRAGVCVNVMDDRLRDRNGAIACTPSTVELWEIKRPQPGSTKPVDAANAEILRDAVRALGSATVAGKRNERVTFAPPLAGPELCTSPVEITVLLRNQRKGRATLGMRAAPTAGDTARSTDTDVLTLTCLPPS
jgi:Carbamoyltransferase C-terminus